MSAQPQPQQDQPARSQRASSTETRLTIVETQWGSVIPTLATKEDIARSDAKTIEAIAEIKDVVVRLESAMREMRADIRADIQSESSSQLKWVVGSLIACFGVLVAIMALMQGNTQSTQVVPIQQPPPAVVAPVQPAPLQHDQSPATPERTP